MASTGAETSLSAAVRELAESFPLVAWRLNTLRINASSLRCEASEMKRANWVALGGLREDNAVVREAAAEPLELEDAPAPI